MGIIGVTIWVLGVQSLTPGSNHAGSLFHLLGQPAWK